MHRRALLPCALALVWLSLVRGEDPAAIPWRTDLAAARSEALAAGKPLFLVFRCEP